MATVTTDRAVNPGQLSVELGRVPLRVVHGEPTVVDAPTVDDDTLQAGVDEHVADPDWEDPAPPDPPAPSVEEAARIRLRELKGKGWANLTAAEKAEVAERLLEALA